MEKVNQRDVLITRKLPKVVAAVGAFTLPFALTSCSSGSPPIEITPNMSGFLAHGSTTTCYDGGARPCAVQLRTAPKLSSAIINVKPNQGHVYWPVESYNGAAGDQLTIECYVANGQRITPYEGNSSSTYWYEVAVPEQHVLNPVVINEMNEANSPLRKIQLDGQTAIVGLASTEWFNQNRPAANVPAC